MDVKFQQLLINKSLECAEREPASTALRDLFTNQALRLQAQLDEYLSNNPDKLKELEECSSAQVVKSKSKQTKVKQKSSSKRVKKPTPTKSKLVAKSKPKKVSGSRLYAK